MSSAKWRPFCLDLNVLKAAVTHVTHNLRSDRKYIGQIRATLCYILALEVPRYVTRSRRPFLMMSADQHRRKIIDRKGNVVESKNEFAVSIVPAEGLAPLW